MKTLLQNVRFSPRMLIKNWAFTSVVVLVLALGIGANSMIFSVINAVLLRALPYKDSERLVLVWENVLPNKDGQVPFSAPDFLDYRTQNTVFENMAAFNPSADFNLTGVDEPERLHGCSMSASLFPLLGVNPLLGRTFVADDEKPGGEPVTVLSHALWQRRFGSSRGVLNKSLTLDGKNYTVIGVMPAGFSFPINAEKVDLWVPLVFTPEDLSMRLSHSLNVIAKLKPGVSLQQAQTELGTIASRLQQQYPDSNNGWGAWAGSLTEQITGDVRPALLILFAAVVLILLIACANIANLLLFRAVARQREIAIRAAVGASRFKLIQQLLTESLTLSLLGGALGLLLALLGGHALAAFISDKIPRATEIGLDGRVILFTLTVSVLTAVLFGLMPAVHSSKVNLNESLKEGAKGSMGGFGRSRVRSLLVIAEVGLALMLLISAGLMLKSFSRLQQLDLGYNPENVLTMQISLPELKYKEAARQGAFFQQVVERVGNLPGVRSAGVSTGIPFGGAFAVFAFSIEGRVPPTSMMDYPAANYQGSSPNYFSAMGLPLVKGGAFTERDTADAPAVAIINETLARRYFPNEDPLGKRIKVLSPDPNAPWVSIVGVAKDVSPPNPGGEVPAQLYLPYLQNPWPLMVLVVRTNSDPRSLIGAVRNAVREVDREQPVYKVETMENLVANSRSQPRLYTILLTAFGGVALVLAIVGLYGLMAYSVSHRTHEIGIRMALGAQRSNVVRLILGQGMMLAVTGIIAGLIGAFAVTRIMSSLLYGVSSGDPVIFICASLVLALVACIACYLPARKATQLNPLIALRYE